MTNQRFEGLVVGGPLDGKTLAHVHRCYDCVERVPFRAITPLEGDLLHPSLKEINYYHLTVAEQGFWIEAVHDDKWLMERLVETYWMYNDLNQ